MPDSGFRVIRIVSASPLDPERARALAARLAEKLGLANYDLRQDVDPALIGGVVIYAGGFRYDYSIRGQLSRIAGRLKTQKSIDETGHADEPIPGDLIRDNLNDALLSFDERPIAPGGEDVFAEVSAVREDEEDAGHQTMVDRLREALETFSISSTVDEVGQITSISDGVATVRGLQNCRNGELIQFTASTFGLALNLETDQVGIVLLQPDSGLREGGLCKRTGQTISVPTGTELLGRVVDPLGLPIDGLGPLTTDQRRPIEFDALRIIDRQPVDTPLATGITAIDAMTPIGRGQRELIIGDRQTGKTAIAIDTILNQRGKNVYCIYVAIGQKMSTVASVVSTLQLHDAMAYTTVVVASASATASLQYIAPYAGCAMAEALMYDRNADVLIVYDDLTKHAAAYRAISLLLRRPPGREAYPGDIFYLHARLLERAGRRNNRLGGGSITALPIVETQSGDISAYIPTNMISITDGQIYLESELFFAGQRPAINVGLSVSRVGGAAQTKAMKKVAGPLRILLAQYRALASFSQFSSELDEETRRQLKTGEQLMEVLKQPQYHPIPIEEQVIMLYLAHKGMLIKLDREDVQSFLSDFLRMVHDRHPELLAEMAESKLLTEAGSAWIDQAAADYIPRWISEHEDYGTTG